MITNDCPTEITLSVIVLGYNGRRFLDGCLGSLLDQDFTGTHEVIYADNGSADDALSYARQHFPAVRCIDLGHNLGFAGGNNAAAQQAVGRYLLFVNQDIVAHRGLLSAMYAAMRADDSLGACHANMLMPWHPGFDAQERVQLPNTVQITEIGRYGFVEYRQAAMQTAPIPTRFLSGACFMIERRLLAHLPYLFDERFFAYSEDLDLALRIGALGYNIVLVPGAVIYHLHESKQPFAKQIRRAYWATRNRLLAYYKTTPRGALLRLLPWLVFGAPVKALQVEQDRTRQIVAFLGLVPVSLAAFVAGLARVPGYAAERKYWVDQGCTNELSATE